ncbi:PAS domain S-box protein [Halosimplex sp. J119]
MDVGSIRDAVAGRGVGDTGDRNEGSVDPPSRRTGVASNATDAERRVRRQRVALASLALGCMVLVAIAADASASLGGGAGALVGLLATGVVGLAASSDREDAVAAMTDRIERARAGEDVSFDTDRDDELGELAEAVSGLTEDLRECERERDLRERVIDSAPVGISVADATAEDAPLIAVNERFEELTGYEESECVGRNCRFLQGEETDEERIAELRRAVENEEETTVELRNYRKDGTEFWNRVRLAPVETDGEVTHFVGFQEDVTERVEREAELERRGSLLDAIFEQLPLHIYAKDRDARHVRYSTAFAAEWSPDLIEKEVLGKTDVEVFDAEFAEEAYEDDLEVIETGEPIVNKEEYVDHADEWNLTTKVPWRGSDGELRGLIGVSRQITERKRQQQELEQYREFTTDIIDSIDDVFYVLDADGHPQRWNETLAEVTGYDDVEIESMHATDFFVEEDRDAIRRGIASIDRAAGVPLEARLRTKDGEAIPYEIVASPMENPEGERVIVGIGRDISERRERERQLEAIVENTEDPIYIKDREGRYQFANEAVAEPFDLDPEGVIGKPDEEFFDEATVQDIREDDRRVLETGESVSREVIRPIDGDDRVFLDHKYPYRDEDGEVVGVMGISRDITERKEAERELREREQRLEEYREYTEDILDAIDDVFYVFDDAGKIQRWNESFAELTGYDDAEIESMHGTDFFPESEHARVVEAIATVFSTGEDGRVEAPVLTKDGERIPYEFVASRLENPDGEHVLVGIGRDVSERKARERELRATKNRLQKFIETSPVGVVATDTDGEVTLWNDAMEDIFGWSADEVLGAQYPAVPDGVEDDVRQRVLDGESVSGVELKRVRADGEVIDVSLSTGPIYDEDGEVTELVGYIEDITERKERERELAARSAAMEQASDGIAILDENSVYQFVNQAHADVYGYDDPGAFLDETWEMCYHEEERERLAEEAVPSLLEEGEWRGEAVGLTADGERFPQELSLTALDDGRQICVVRDITDRKERERELARFKRAVEASGHSIYMTDADREITYVNPAFEETTGYSAAEAVGQTPAILHSGEHGQEYYDALWDTIRAGEVWDEEIIDRRKNGELYYAEQTIAPVTDESGTVDRFVAVQNDITERKERERELERYETVAQTASDAIVTIDTDSVIRDVNPAVRDVFGYDPADLVGEPLSILMPDRLTEDHFAALERYLSSGEKTVDWDSVEFPGVRADGSEVPLGISFTEYEHDGERFFAGIIRDVSERVERERELERTTDLLKQVQQMANVGGWELDVSGEEPTQTWTEELYRIHDFPQGMEVELDDIIDSYHPDDRERVRETVEESIEEGTGYEIEARIVVGSGEVRWVRAIGYPVDDVESPAVFRGSVQDITEQKERERELERTTDLLSRVEQMADVGGWTSTVTEDGTNEIQWTDNVYDIFEVPPEEGPMTEGVFEYIHPDDRADHRQHLERAWGGGEPWDTEYRIVTGEGTERWVHSICEPVVEDGHVTELRGSLQDITDRKERELALESLHEATRGLLGVESNAEAADLVVDTAHAVLDVAGVAVYLLDDTTNQLDALACSDGFESLCDAEPVGASAGDSLLWNTYVTGTPTVFDDTQAATQSNVFGPDVGGGLLVPVGNHGVFVVATRDRAVDQSTRRLAETLVATTEAAFDRLASEETLRERDAELEAQNSRLRRQIQITDLIRRIDQSLIQAESREAIESAVCDRLVESDDVAFAWIGSLDAADDRLEPSAWAGDGADYLDTVSLAADESAEPAVATAVSEQPTVVRNVVDDLKREEWRQTALSEGFQSVLSVPIAFEEYFYGVLTVYAGEPDAFGDLEREVFAELGENVAHSMNAVETQRALHTDQRVELTLEFDAADDVLGRLATEADCTVEFAGLATHSESETGLFVTASGAPAERVEDVLEDLVSVATYRLVSDGDGESDEGRLLFEVTVGADTLPSRFVRHGAGPQTIRATAAGIEAVVDVPTGTDVREFVEMLAETHPSVELASRRTVERGDETGGTFATRLFEALTDRQLEVLRTAYFAGFFEWPRTSTGEDVAEMLDVSQPTVNRHLRLGQQRLLRQLFEETSAEVEAAAD